MKPAKTNYRDYGVRRDGKGSWYLQTELGSWYPASRREVRRYLVRRWKLSNRCRRGHSSEVELALDYIITNFSVDYAGREAEAEALNYRHQLGATPSSSYRLRSGEYEVANGNYTILTTCDIRLPTFDL
jgi:hypothetical protein